MKKSLLILNIILIISITFLAYRNNKLKNQKEFLENNLNINLVIIDSLIKEKYIFITTHYIKYFNEDAKKVLILGYRLIEENGHNRKKFAEFYEFCKFYNNEKYIFPNSNYSKMDIKLLQLITLENITNWLDPYYQFDAFRIIAVEEDLKQSNNPAELRLWFDYARRNDYNNGKDYVKIVYNNDTITKKDIYFNIKYIPKQKGKHFIPVKVLFVNQPGVRDYTIFVDVK